MSKWSRKEEWRREGKEFRIVVSRHEADWVAEGEGKNRWCVYVYVFPKHPTFAQFDLHPLAVKNYWDQPTPAMHGGCTFFKVHRDEEGAARSIQYGCDYSHYQDDHYYHMVTPNDAWSVFADADDLFSIMAEREQATGEPK